MKQAWIRFEGIIGSALGLAKVKSRRRRGRPLLSLTLLHTSLTHFNTTLVRMLFLRAALALSALVIGASASSEFLTALCKSGSPAEISKQQPLAHKMLAAHNCLQGAQPKLNDAISVRPHPRSRVHAGTDLNRA